jgi:hypothetical protein
MEPWSQRFRLETIQTEDIIHKWKYFQLFQNAYGHKTSTVQTPPFHSYIPVKDKISVLSKVNKAEQQIKTSFQV